MALLTRLSPEPPPAPRPKPGRWPLVLLFVGMTLILGVMVVRNWLDVAGVL